jgi:hypothetical protein
VSVPHESTDWPWKLPLHRRDGTVRAYALVDEEDYRRLSGLAASLTNRGYVQLFLPGAGRGHRRKGKGQMILMHREILGLRAGDGQVADHRNSDGLDNRRANLRICSQGENAQNQNVKGARGSSGHRGVHWNSERGKWTAQVKVEGRSRHVGNFDTQEEAAAAAATYRAEHLPFSER